MYRSYRVRLRPSATQREALLGVLAISCDLYNAALQERRDAWKISRKRITYHDQTAQLTELRREDKEIASIAADVAREPLRRVHRAFQGFFTRVRRGNRPGYPRFRTKDRYDSLAYHNPQIRSGRLVVPNLGHITFRTHREIIGRPKSVIIKRRDGKWIARITCDVGPAPPKVTVLNAIGIDVGLAALATLSDGTIIENPRWIRKAEERLAKAAQKLSRKQRQSKNRIRARAEFARAHERIANARNNYLHHVSKWLVNRYDLIAFEKLQINNMVRSKLAKSIMDAAWGILLSQLSYKAESAGRYVIAVNPKGTTQSCSGCGTKVLKTLSERMHECPNCSLSLSRDHNAALNILRLGVSHAGVSIPSERVLIELSA